jgi:trimeric autotransporter adhesin
VHFRLSDNVEDLILTGADNLQGYGNALANTLTGNSGVNLLAGGAGNDTYVVHNTSTAVLENANEGTDTVHATVHFRLAANVENIVLDGIEDLQGYGNALANTLTGNSGIDLLAGGDGDDTYFVDNAGTAVLENANEGTDIVHATVHFRLAANLEILVLDGSADLQGYGNGDANRLAGNSGNNLLDGGGLADLLIGNDGNDVFLFHAFEAGGDTVFDFTSGDALAFAGFGAGTFARLGATNQWQITSAIDTHTETITIANGASITAGEFVFL